MKLIVLMCLVLFFSCNHKKETVSQTSSEEYFNAELQSKLLEYQKLYPIPSSGDAKNSGLYVYIVSFYKEAKDTIVTIKRAADGLSLSNWNLVFGVYQDKDILPTFIRDTSAQYSKSFLNSEIVDSTSYVRFKPIKGQDYPEGFPPVYEYKVDNGNLMLRRIDTVWTKW